MLRLVAECRLRKTYLRGYAAVRRTSPIPGAPAVELARISHAYGDTQALVDIDLRVRAASRVALIGPDGVGKSTLLGLVSGVRRLQQGQLHVLGADLARRRDRAKVGTRIAFMPQGLGGNLYRELSVLEDLHFLGRLYGHSEPNRDERVATLTGATGLSPFLDRPVATADMSEAEQFDSVVAIDRGRIVAHGSPQELREEQKL